MIKKAESGLNQSYPSWVYAFLAQLMHTLSTEWTLKLLGWLSPQKRLEENDA